MRKWLIIIVTAMVLFVLMAFIYKYNVSEPLTKVINDNLEISVLPVSSDKYAELMGAERKDYSEYGGSHYYFLRITNIGGVKNPILEELHSIDDFGSRVNYISNNLASDLSLIVGSDTLECSLAHWERTYNIRKDITVSLAFKKENNKRPKKLIWNDQLFTGIPLKFKLD